MSLIICRECGKEISDKASNCPNCGCPVNLYNEYTQPPQQRLQPQPTQNNAGKKKDSALSIWAAVLSLFGCTIFIGVILAIIDLCKNDKTKRHLGSFFSLIFAGFYLIVSILTYSPEEETEKIDNQATVQETSKSSSETTEEMETDQVEEVNENIPTLEKQVIYDGNGLVITANRIEDAESHYNISILIENNSDLDLSVCARAHSINGFVAESNIYNMYTDVASGKKANAILEIDKSPIEAYELGGYLNHVDVLFWAYNKETSMKEFDSGQVMIKMNGYEELTVSFDGQELYSEKDIIIKFIKQEGNLFAYTLENYSGNYINFDVDCLTINDYTSSEVDYDLIQTVVLNNGTKLFFVEPSDEWLSENGISSIQKIEFNMKIRPLESYSDEYETGTILYEAK